MSAVSAIREAVLSTNAGYGAYMTMKWGASGRDVPRADWMNSALRDRAQVDASIAEVKRLRLPPCPDETKNWDSLAAVREVLLRTSRSARVLDAGAEMYSRFLPWLYLHGYRNLCGNNLVFRQIRRRGPIMYEPGDVTAMRFPAGSFDVVACLSVIEHGVDLAAYFREMSRVLKPGGMLVTSTDYFETPIDTRGQQAYGVPIHVFDKAEILEAVAEAARHGLRMTGPLDLSCGERVVRWDPFALDYTFVVFAMVKV